MKSSVGVTICAVVVLIGSVLALIGAVGAAFVFVGPLSGQLFDPANLPPGADVGMMRAVMLSGVLFAAVFAAFGITTGIGLIRLWKWARYAAITLGVLVLILFVLPGLLIAFAAAPPPSARPGANITAGVRLVVAGFYAVWAILDGVFIYVMMRKSTIAQFSGGVVEMATRARPLSVSIIAWFMIASAAMGLPMMAMTHLPAFVLGLLLMGGWAKAYYIVYFSLYVLLGLGLLKRTSEAIAPAIGFHVFGVANTLVMAVPSVWARYQTAIRSMGVFGADAPAAAMAPARYFAVATGLLVPAVIIFFLARARRSLPPPAND